MARAVDRGLAGERFSIEQSIDIPRRRPHLRRRLQSAIVPADTVTGLAIFSTDVTERTRAAEAARQHQAELTHVLRVNSMGEMAAGLAHEINQPLDRDRQLRAGQCAAAARHPPQVEPVLAVIDDIAAEAVRAGEIIRRLRSLIRKEAPRQDWVDLNEMVGEVVRFAQPEARQHGVTVRVHADARLPALVADRIQIEQVILNLVRNAVDAMHEVEGAASWTFAPRRWATTRSSCRCATRAGPGGGGARSYLRAVLLHQTAGLGMGLSISRTIIEAHQGRLGQRRRRRRHVSFHPAGSRRRRHRQCGDVQLGVSRLSSC